MMAHDRRLRVPTPTDAKIAEKQGRDAYSAFCRKKFREFKKHRHMQVSRVLAYDMREWLESEEAKDARRKYIG